MRGRGRPKIEGRIIETKLTTELAARLRQKSLETTKSESAILRELCECYLEKITKSKAKLLNAPNRAKTLSLVAPENTYSKFDIAVQEYLKVLQYGNSNDRAKFVNEKLRLPTSLKSLIGNYQWTVTESVLYSAVSKIIEDIMSLIPRHELTPQQTEETILELIDFQLHE